MSDTDQLAENPGDTAPQVSALRQVIINSRLNVKRVASVNPLATERWNLSPNAQKLVDDFARLKTKYETLDDKLQAASEDVRAANQNRADTAKRELEGLTGTEVGTSDDERAKRQKKIDELGTLIDGYILRVDDAVKREKEVADKRVADAQQGALQLEEDKKLVASIGTTFDDLQTTYGDKLDKEKSGRIDGLRRAFAAVTSGTRPLDSKERTSATTLQNTDRQQWAALYASHVTLTERMVSEEGLKVPADAAGGERNKIDAQRTALDKLLALRPVTEDNIRTATANINTLANTVSVTADAIGSRKAEIKQRRDRRTDILALLKTDAYAVPQGAEGTEGDAPAAQNLAIVNALPTDPPTPQELKKAEQLLPALAKAVSALTDIIAERQRQAAARSKRRGEILGLLKTEPYTFPTGTADTQNLGNTISGALADDPPAVAKLDTAEKTLVLLGQAVAQAKLDIAEAAAAKKRMETLKEKWETINFTLYGPLLGKIQDYKNSRKDLDPLVGRGGPDSLSDAAFQKADGQIETIKRLITELTADFESEQQTFQSCLAPFNYLADEIIEVRRKDNAAADGFNVRLLRLQAQGQAALRLPIQEFNAAAVRSVETALAGLNTLAGEIADFRNPPTGPVTTFDWQDPTTWKVQAIRYAGTGTAGYVGGLSGSDPTLVGRISRAEVGDRHSAAKIMTGRPMHQHTDGGSGGISFGYSHLGDTRVEPVIYDYASKRNGNTYQWQNDAPSSGPAGLPGSVKARA